MAASMVVEHETGTYVSTGRHRHNGYYAGDFSQNAPLPGAWRTLMNVEPRPLTTTGLRRSDVCGERPAGLSMFPS